MVAHASQADRFAPVDLPRVAVSGDGSLAAIHEVSRVTLLELPGGAPFAEIGADPDALASEVAWVGAPPRLLVLSRYDAHSTAHLIDPFGPSTIAEIRLEATMRLVATVGGWALVVGSLGAAVLTAGESYLSAYQFPARVVPVSAGPAANLFLVALASSVEEWDPQSRMPRRRLRLPRPAAITAVGGSERLVWMTTQQEPARIDVFPLVNRGQPKGLELPEPILRITGHPRSDLVACIGAESGRLYIVDLDGRTRLRVIDPEGFDRVDAASLVIGRITGVLAARARHPIAIVRLDGRDPELEPASASAPASVLLTRSNRPIVIDERDVVAHGRSQPIAIRAPLHDEPLASPPSSAEPQVAMFSLRPASHDEPLHDELSSDEPLHDELSSDEHLHDELSSDERLHDELSADEPLHDELSADEPLHDELSSDEPLHDELSSDEPLHDELSSDKPLHDELSSDEPLHDELLADERPHDERPHDERPHDERPPEGPRHDEPSLDETAQRLRRAMAFDEAARRSQPATPLDEPARHSQPATPLDEPARHSQPATPLDEPARRSQPAIALDDPARRSRPAIPLVEPPTEEPPDSPPGTQADRPAAAPSGTSSVFRAAGTTAVPARPAQPSKAAPTVAERFSAWRDMVRHSQVPVEPSAAPRPNEPSAAPRANEPSAAPRPNEPGAAQRPFEGSAARSVASVSRADVPRSWRDELVSWHRAVAGADDDSAVRAPDAAAIEALVARFELAPRLAPVLARLYGAHLCGEAGVAPVDVARMLDRQWDEALGRGELARAGVCEYVRSRVALSLVVLRALDELPPLTGALIGTPGPVALLGPCVVVAGDEPLVAVAERCLSRVGGAILVAHSDVPCAPLAFEARAYGAAAMLRIDRPEPMTSDDPVIFVVDDSELADRLGVPYLP